MKTVGAFRAYGADAILTTIFGHGDFCTGALSIGGRRIVLEKTLVIALALLLGSGAASHAETQEAVKKEENQCFCLVNKDLLAVLREKPTHYGCRRVRTPNKHTPEIRCVNDGDGSAYSVEFDASKDFQAQFDEIAGGAPRCDPCVPVIKAKSGTDNPRNGETGAVDK
jgi:hypothetical protein